MSILERIRDISAATLNEWLEQSEDPVRLIDRFLSEQQRRIDETSRLYQQCLRHAESLRAQYRNAEQLAEKRENQAMLALKAGEETIARIALQEKMQYEETSEKYRELYEQSLLSVAELEEQLRQLRAEYDEVLAKRGYYQARLETARLQRMMNERLAQRGGNAMPRAFQRLEDAISDLELEAKALRDVRQATKEALVRAGDTLQQTIEAEMERLRKKLEEGGWTQR